MSRAPGLQELVLEEAVFNKKSERMERLRITCPRLILLDVKYLEGVRRIELRTERKSSEIITVKGGSDIEI